MVTVTILAVTVSQLTQGSMLSMLSMRSMRWGSGFILHFLGCSKQHTVTLTVNFCAHVLLHVCTCAGIHLCVGSRVCADIHTPIRACQLLPVRVHTEAAVI
jgi:hypothetical protein